MSNVTVYSQVWVFEQVKGQLCRVYYRKRSGRWIELYRETIDVVA